MLARWLSFVQEQTLWHSLNAWGKGPLFGGEWHHPSQQAPFVCLCLHCLIIDMPLASFMQPVERVVSDLLTTNNAAPAKHPVVTFATRCSGLLVTVLWVGRSL